MLKVRQISVQNADWQGPPIKIALVSDFHIGGMHVSPKRMINLVALINAQSPDLVLIAGDFVSGHESFGERSDEFNEGIQLGVGSLNNLSSEFGTFAAIGNHDDYYGGAILKELLAQSDVSVLENESSIVRNKTSFCLVGLPDSWTGEYDESAFQNCVKDQFIIALMHSPDSFQYLRTDTDLAVAGHTHGGQINIPLIGRRVTATDLGPDFAYGKVDYNGITGIVTAGIGTSILPARFRAPPEIVLISLSGE